MVKKFEEFINEDFRNVREPRNVYKRIQRQLINYDFDKRLVDDFEPATEQDPWNLWDFSTGNVYYITFDDGNGGDMLDGSEFSCYLKDGWIAPGVAYTDSVSPDFNNNNARYDVVLNGELVNDDGSRGEPIQLCYNLEDDVWFENTGNLNIGELSMDDFWGADDTLACLISAISLGLNKNTNYEV